MQKNGAQGWNRTTDTRIFNPLLYQLSYLRARAVVPRACTGGPRSSIMRGKELWGCTPTLGVQPDCLYRPCKAASCLEPVASATAP